MASRIIPKEEGHNCTLSQQTYGNSHVGCLVVDFLLKEEIISTTCYVQMHRNLWCAHCEKHFLKNWHPSTCKAQLTLYIWHHRQLQRMAGECSSTHHTVQTWAPLDDHLF